MRLAGAHQVINGVVKDFQLYTCNYNPALREQTRGNILYPVNISIAGSTPQDKGLHLEVISLGNFSTDSVKRTIFCSFSYSFYEKLSKPE